MSSLRPCKILHRGDLSEYECIFHGWVDFGKQKVRTSWEEESFVGVIEYPNGRIRYETPKRIVFLDTKRQLEKILKGDGNNGC